VYMYQIILTNSTNGPSKCIHVNHVIKTNSGSTILLLWSCFEVPYISKHSNHTEGVLFMVSTTVYSIAGMKSNNFNISYNLRFEIHPRL